MTVPILSIFLFGGCFLLPKEEELLAPPIMEAPEITYRTVAVKKGSVENSVRVTGYFVYAEQYSVSFKSMTGRLRDIHVEYGEVVEEGQILAELETDNLAVRIEQQELVARKAELNRQRLEIVGADKFSLEIADIDLQLARLSLEDLQINKERAILRSPMEGEVVYISNVYEGDFINSYKTMFQVADRSKLYLSYQGNNLQEFRLGMHVKIIIDKVDYEGEVVMTPAQFPFDAPESQKRQIFFELPIIPEGVRKGDSAIVYLILEKNDDTLIIPRSQVQHYMGRKYVYVLEEGIRAERNIETGIQNATEVEVVNGLAEGELVVLR